jgi:hypothetical protein
MGWSTGLALLPALICGGMMFGGAALAAIGLRRTATTESGDGSTPPDAGTHDNDRMSEPTR